MEWVLQELKNIKGTLNMILQTKGNQLQIDIWRCLNAAAREINEAKEKIEKKLK